MIRIAGWCVALAGASVVSQAVASSPLVEHAEAVASEARTPAGAAWLDRADDVSGTEARPLAARTIHVRFRPNRALTAEAFDALPEEEREGWRAYEITPETYLSTFYGSPIAYLPAIDHAAEALAGSPDAPADTFEGARVLDLGYGQIGQLEMLAACGAEVVGVEVDPILTLLYEDALEARAVPNPAGPDGSVRVTECLWPNEAACRDDVGGGYDVILARNLLKRGYVKPVERIGGYVPVADGMSDEQACQQFYDALDPGGVVVIYSLGPAPDPAKPWSDIANPWARDAWESTGFEVVHHDVDVSDSARDLFVALGYGERPQLDESLFGVCSVYRRPDSD